MLPNQNRLRRRGDFAKIYANGDRYRGKHLNLRILVDSNAEFTKIGIVVSKKVSKLAVSRNRFKRQLRDIFRQFLSQLSGGFQIVVTVLVCDREPSYQQLYDDVKYLLAKAKVLHGN